MDGQTVYYSLALYLTEGGWETRNTFHSNWEYQCFDVYQAAQEDDRFDTDHDHRIIWMYFDYWMNTVDDYWIDNVSITANKPASVNHRKLLLVLSDIQRLTCDICLLYTSTSPPVCTQVPPHPCVHECLPTHVYTSASLPMCT